MSFAMCFYVLLQNNYVLLGVRLYETMCQKKSIRQYKATCCFFVKLSVLSVLVVRKNQIRNTQMSGRLTALAI